MPMLPTVNERISDLTIRAKAITSESILTRQAWSDNFNHANDRDRAVDLLMHMSKLTAEASVVRCAIDLLRESPGSGDESPGDGNDRA